MKKVLAILLVVCLVAALAACGTKDDTNTSAPPSNTGSSAPPSDNSSAPPSDNGDSEDNGTAWPVNTGFFDPDFDYSVFPNFKVGFLSFSNGFLNVEWDKANVDWAARMNINYTGMWAPATQGDIDGYFSAIQTYCDQGYDGLLLMPESTTYVRCKEICDENDMLWFAVMSQARDYAGDSRLVAPSVGMDQYGFGRALFHFLWDWKEANHPDVDWENVGFVNVEMGTSVELRKRADACEMLWAERLPEFGVYDPSPAINPKNFWVADVTTGNRDQVTAQNLTTQIITANPNIEVWLVAANVDQYAMGAANAIENLNLIEQSAVACCGGSDLIQQWDSGVKNAWRAAYFTPQSIFAETGVCALWEYMAGHVTPETIWPEWVNVNDKGDRHDASGNVIEEFSYATMLLSSCMLAEDTYKTYLEWSDLYCYGPDSDGHYNYDKVYDLSLFTVVEEIPAHYSVKQ